MITTGFGTSLDDLDRGGQAHDVMCVTVKIRGSAALTVMHDGVTQQALAGGDVHVL